MFFTLLCQELTNIFISAQWRAQHLQTLLLPGQCNITNPARLFRRAQVLDVFRALSPPIPDSGFAKVHLHFGMLPQGGSEEIKNWPHALGRTDNIHII